MPVQVAKQEIQFLFPQDGQQFILIAEQLWDILNMKPDERPKRPMLTAFTNDYEITVVDNEERGVKYCYVDVYGRRIQTQNMRKPSSNTAAIIKEASKGGDLRITWIIRGGMKGKIIVKKSMLGILQQVYSLQPETLRYENKIPLRT